MNKKIIVHMGLLMGMKDLMGRRATIELNEVILFSVDTSPIIRFIRMMRN